jgi:hypothetical protein
MRFYLYTCTSYIVETRLYNRMIIGVLVGF